MKLQTMFRTVFPSIVINVFEELLYGQLAKDCKIVAGDLGKTVLQKATFFIREK